MSRTQAGYESVAYPHYVHPLADPARLAALGAIFGLRPVDPNAARVLESAARGWQHLLAMAARLPGSHFLGLDFAGPDIASGSALAAEAGLDNVELRQQDLLTWQPGEARFETAQELSAMGLSQLETEQMIDYVVNRSFRATLLSRVEATDGALHPKALSDLCFRGCL